MIHETLPWTSIGTVAARRELKSPENILSSISDPVVHHFTKICYELAFDEEPNYGALNDILKNNIKK
jgi:hypothetical protein